MEPSPPLPIDKRLIQVATFLRNAAPPEYLRFLEVFTQYADSVTVKVIGANRDDILGVQGQARQCATLAKMFWEIEYPPQPPSPAQPASASQGGNP